MQKENIVGKAVQKSKAAKYTRFIEWGGMGILLIISGFFLWRKYQNRREESAQNELWPLAYYVENEYYEKAEQGDGVNFGLYWIVENYENTKAGQQALYTLAHIHIQKCDFQKAITFLQRIKQSKDSILDTFFIHLSLANCYREMGDFKRASEYYQKAISYNPNEHLTPLALIQLAKMYEQKRELKEALATYQMARERFETTPHATELLKNIARIETLLAQES